MGDDAAKTGAAVAGGSFLGIALALFLSRRAQAKPLQGGEVVALDDAAMAALLAIAENSEGVDDIINDLHDIATAVQQLAAALGGPTALQNPDSFVAFTRVIPVAGTAVQLPYFPVPYDMELVVKSNPGNAGNIFVGRNQADTQNLNTRYTLIQNEAVGLKVDRTDRVWVDAAVAGDWVMCIVEQKAGGD